MKKSDANPWLSKNILCPTCGSSNLRQWQKFNKQGSPTSRLIFQCENEACKRVIHHPLTLDDLASNQKHLGQRSDEELGLHPHENPLLNEEFDPGQEIDLEDEANYQPSDDLPSTAKLRWKTPMDFTWKPAKAEIKQMLAEGKTIPEIYGYLDKAYGYPGISTVQLIESVITEMLPQLPQKFRVIHLELMAFHLFQKACEKGEIKYAYFTLNRIRNWFYPTKKIRIPRKIPIDKNSEALRTTRTHQLQAKLTKRRKKERELPKTFQFNVALDDLSPPDHPENDFQNLEGLARKDDDVAPSSPDENVSHET